MKEEKRMKVEAEREQINQKGGKEYKNLVLVFKKQFDLMNNLLEAHVIFHVIVFVSNPPLQLSKFLLSV
jgi:hypothetical protein